MTDKVIELHAKTISPEPVIPAWVPGSVAGWMRQQLADDQQWGVDRDIVLRLATDPRMRSVWSELLRPSRRPEGGFLHPAKVDWAPTAVERQDMALVLLLGQVYAGVGSRAALRSDVEQHRAELRELADKLRREAEDLGAEEDFASVPLAEWRSPKLNAAADVLEARAAHIDDRYCLIVERDRGQLEARPAATWISNSCVMLFGSPLHGVTAILTSVALDCEVPEERVRGWCRVERK
jgi:hypothetical protein